MKARLQVVRASKDMNVENGLEAPESQGKYLDLKCGENGLPPIFSVCIKATHYSDISLLVEYPSLTIT